MGNPTATLAPAKDTSPENNQSHNWRSIAVTAAIIIAGIIIVGLFQHQINDFGMTLMKKYGQGKVDVILFFLTAVSCTPLALPIWGYALVGIALGYDIFRLALVMAVGSALGSSVTFGLGRYFGKHPWVRKRFPNLEKHSWTQGKSRKMVTWLLFIGTASPLPIDVMYAACGVNKYPFKLFIFNMMAARLVRYIYLGYLFTYFPHLFA